MSQSSTKRPLTEALLILTLFLILCTIEAIPWAWGLAGDVPLGVQVASHVIAALDLLIILLIGGRHALRIGVALTRDLRRPRLVASPPQPWRSCSSEMSP